MPARAPTLSKSRIQSGRQCHKRLWLEIHQRDAADWGDSAQARLDEGTRFGELARELLGGGVLIDADHFQIQQALDQTAHWLERPRREAPMLFEAAFSHQGVRVRVDALRRELRSDSLIEVKSTTQAKEEHYWDCAIQTWVARGAGRKVRRVYVGHIDNRFVYRRANRYDGLLTLTDITDEVEARLPEIPALVRRLKRIAGGEMPAIGTGDHCGQPYECPFLGHCRSFEPSGPEFPVDLLPNNRGLAAALKAQGYADLRQVPDALMRTEVHRRIAQATRSGRPFVSDELHEKLTAIGYPRYYLDFETIAFVIPRWLGTRPFQAIPFQFSCHIEARDGSLKHRAWLDLSGDAPMRGFVEALIKAVGKRGPILVWNMGFESGRLRDLAALLPEHAETLHAMINRMVDLLPIYRQHYYHPEMRGSWSIKAVLPTLAPDLDYGDLEVGDGSAAQEAYRRAIDPETSPDERDEVARQLLAYCERDTLAMTRLT